MMVHGAKRILGLVAAGAALVGAQGQTKVYGFADFRFSKSWVESNNLLIPEGYINSDANFYLGHVDPYIDWNPNENVRALVEMNFNPEAAVANKAGTRLRLSQKGEAELRGILTQSTIGQLMANGVPAGTAATMAEPIVAGIMDGVKANSEIIAGQPAEKKRSKFFELVRAQMDLKVNDAVNVRFGRFLTPVGIWSVDHGSPVILTVQQPYYVSTVPIFPQVQEGAMLFGNKPIGDNDLSYSLYLSKGREDADEGNNRIENFDDLSLGGQAYIKVDALNGTRFGLSGYAGRERKDDMWGDAPYEIGLLKDPAYSSMAPASLAPALPYLRNDTLFLDEINYSKTRVQDLREFCWGVDFKTSFGRFSLQGEMSGAYIKNDMVSGKSGSAFDYYLLASYDHPLNSSVTLSPYLFYEELTWKDQDQVPGWSLGLEGFPLDGFRTASVGLNTTLWNNVHLKTEYALVWLLPNPQSAHPIFRNKFTTDDLFSHSIQGQLAVAF
jgi:hypothetical protein